MRDAHSFPVFKNAGLSEDGKTVTRMKRDKFSEATVLKQYTVSTSKGQDGKVVRTNTLVKRTPPAPPSEGFHTAEEKRAEAAERDAHRATLTPQQQIAELDRRLGVGIGAQKERARLTAAIEATTAAESAAVAAKQAAKEAAELKAAADKAMPRRPKKGC